MSDYINGKIEYVKGIGPQKAKLLNSELNIFTPQDLINHFPFRYEDRTRIFKIDEINSALDFVQVEGTIRYVETVGIGPKQRLVAYLHDETSEIELIWFKGIKWIKPKIKSGEKFIAFGKPTYFNGGYSIVHPELKRNNDNNHQTNKSLTPIYPGTETLKKKHIDSKSFSEWQWNVLKDGAKYLRETLPGQILQQHNLITKKEAMIAIHFPKDYETLQKARTRLKFEELFFIQFSLLGLRKQRKDVFKGIFMNRTELLTRFYEQFLPFDLTDAQKRVIKEIYKDLKSGEQMNRLLQGDVGSGKTIVAFVCMLICIDSGYQSAFMAPTEILAEQHYNGLKEFCDKLGLKIARLTGSTNRADRDKIHESLLSGSLNIIVGTHALIQDHVNFCKLGLVVIDEQHRFGVAQRAKLWNKKQQYYPHILVMTATPIPRTLAMTFYGDLDVSVIDELPPGRKSIQTIHMHESKRLKLFGFIKEQIEQGRQAYIIYPLIEESEKLDYKNLIEGYDSVAEAFPDIPISIIHGRMKPKDKDYEMQRFLKGETKIMVSTTVIEVGVNVPNASLMIIENAERFGLAQLHQLRGRVGRGSYQSYCVLMTDYKMSKESKARMETMTRTNNGFEIADEDLKLRGPGNLMGTQQSGLLNLKIADLAKDHDILKLARRAAQNIYQDDPKLESKENQILKRNLGYNKAIINWSDIS
ncbi:MAG TPA: ATP-dependent DNA helicase RecG [Cyclobacteriaceae bacterium]